MINVKFYKLLLEIRYSLTRLHWYLNRYEYLIMIIIYTIFKAMQEIFVDSEKRSYKKTPGNLSRVSGFITDYFQITW